MTKILAPLIGRRLLSAVVPIVLWTVLPLAIVCAQSANYGRTEKPEDPGLELLQQEPHDLLFFSEESGGGWVKAVLLDFPGRKPPANPTGQLSFQIIGLEGKEFVANWSDIVRVDLWEVRLEREARERIKNGDFVSAYPYLSTLLRDFPQRDGLGALRREFLWNDAVARAKTGQVAPTLAMLEELRRFAPDYRSDAVIGAIDRVTDRLMADLVQSGELDLAQRVFARLEQDLKNDRLDSITKWNAEFLKMAQAKQDQALAAVEAKDYRAARMLARESVYLKPSIEGGKELIRKIDAIYPLVRVGVLQTAKVLEPTRLDNWGARRSGRLIYRTLFEMEGAGPEGGEYDFIFGDVESSPDRMQFELNLDTGRLPEPLNQVRVQLLADVIADRARESSPTYFAPWAAAVKTVGMNGPKQVKFNLRRPNVLPVSLLQVPVDGSWFGGEVGSPTGEYRRESIEDDRVRYVLSGPPITPTQPREIVEIRCESAAQGVNLLLQGEIDVLDQLFPADAVRLRKNKTVRVFNYPLPTIHMLVPCSDHPYLSQRTFRRALVYGTNREDILQGELLEGLETVGCRILSGPFPAGSQQNDPLAYAYDQNIAPRPYEPPLARLLIAMNANQMKGAAERSKAEVPELKPIRIAFPPDNMSRVACEAIKSQWELLELPVQLVELPIGSTFPEPDEDIADLVYVSAAVWEPVIDARRVLGPEGIAASDDQLIGLGLRRIEEARNWREVRTALVNLHAIAHHELPVIPLWQMVDSYAYRRELVGVGSDIVSLYQNAGKWRLGQ
jgi:ABC-type transport system substrate-binding protein